MAKIKTLNINVNGTDYAINVNCSSTGNFSANLPSEVAKALNIQAKIQKDTLHSVETEVDQAVQRYKNSNTTQELFIFIRYQSSGKYCEYADGKVLFHTQINQKYLFSKSMNNNVDGVGFEFHVVIKETIDGAVNWFKTQQGKDFLGDEKNNYQSDEYYKQYSEKFYHSDNWVKIPFSQSALDTLKMARERIRMVSEMLFKFVEQDEDQILLTLNNQRLLM